MATLAPPGTHDDYATWLRREMEERDVSQRELARRLVGSDHAKVANMAQSIRYYRQGRILPRPLTRDLIAAALGTPTPGPA